METYDEFIQNILDTRGRFNCGEEYHETHHILPRCLGGKNDKGNLIDLFAREHFIAHKLLAKENPDNNKLTYAWWIMSHCKTHKQDTPICTPEEYEEARIEFSKKLSIEMVGENNPFYGKHHTENVKNRLIELHTGMKVSHDARQKMSESRKGDKNNFYGRHHTEDSKHKISLSRINDKNPRSKCVYCPELNMTFGSCREIERQLGICYRSISACLNGEQKHAGKHPITGEKLTWVKMENDRC